MPGQRSNARHLKHDLLFVTKVNFGKFGILLPPLCDVRFITLEALEKMIGTEVRQNVSSLLRHQHARIFRIGQIDFGNLVR